MNRRIPDATREAWMPEKTGKGVRAPPDILLPWCAWKTAVNAAANPFCQNVLGHVGF